jgi:hypothetical protein
MRLASAIIFLFFGVYSLYVARKHWNYVSQLRDSVGNRKIKRQQKGFLVVGILSLLYAAWNIWLLARGNRPYSELIQTAKNPSLVGNITSGIGLFLFYGYSFWRIFKSNPGNRVIECGSITLMLFAVLMALMRIPNLPFDYFWWLWPTLFLLCMLTMFFLLQQGYRALRKRKGPNRA